MENSSKIVFLLLAAAFMLSISSGIAGATDYQSSFHNGSTGNCDGCHTRKSQSAFKNASSSVTGVPSPGLPNQVKPPKMLLGSDSSSTCLICHAAPLEQKQPSGIFVASNREYLASAGIPPSQLTPGGDFGWLLKSYRWSSKGTGPSDELSSGDRHGHNIIAKDYGFNLDLTNDAAPGGTYPSEKLSCTSCHDPHGTYRRSAGGNISRDGMLVRSSGSYSTSPAPDSAGAVGTYRILAGVGYLPTTLSKEHAFKADPPAAISPPDYNRAETSTDTRVAYGKGMSEWCRNCHITTHKNAHPMGNSGKLTDEVIRIYNRYLSAGNTAGSKDKAYSSLVPYEMGTDNYTVLKITANSDGSDRSGPKSGANVMCLTCHRAHASGWDYMTRWNERKSAIVYDGAFVGTDAKSSASPSAHQGRLSVETRKTYYDRAAAAFGSSQKSMCSKCHEKD
ncbi:MAG: hypothetical protein WCP20_01700 [Desulfuromonadales bacterium]